MNPPLAIFDIDGTLCDTLAVDDECFCGVASELLQTSIASWEESPHVTDAGIVDWLWRRYRSRAPTQPEIEDFVARFEAALARQLDQAPNRFAATRGAAPLLDRLRREGWHVGMATGGWSRTALLKLRAADLPVELLSTHRLRTVADLWRKSLLAWLTRLHDRHSLPESNVDDVMLSRVKETSCSP